jgi:hypothetical protein
MFHICETIIVTAGLIASKIHLCHSNRWVGAFNPALTIADQKSPWAKLSKNNQKPGTAESMIVTAELNAPAY